MEKIENLETIWFEHAISGDTIITPEVPRLARSTQQLYEIIDLLEKG